MREEILKNRNLLEGNFIGSMLKDLTAIDDFMDLEINKELLSLITQVIIVSI